MHRRSCHSKPVGLRPAPWQTPSVLMQASPAANGYSPKTAPRSTRHSAGPAAGCHRADVEVSSHLNARPPERQPRRRYRKADLLPRFTLNHLCQNPPKGGAHRKPTTGKAQGVRRGRPRARRDEAADRLRRHPWRTSGVRREHRESQERPCAMRVRPSGRQMSDRCSGARVLRPPTIRRSCSSSPKEAVAPRRSLAVAAGCGAVR